MILLKNINSLIKSTLAIALVAALGLMSGCDDDDGGDVPVNNTEVQRVFTLLSSGDWNVSGVMVDDLDFSSTYPGLSLTFGEATYTSINGGGIFASSGTWTFASTAADIIVIDNDLNLDVLEITETSLVIGLVWNERTIGTGGRSESVSGNHVFTFNK